MPYWSLLRVAQVKDRGNLFSLKLNDRPWMTDLEDNRREYNRCCRSFMLRHFVGVVTQGELSDDPWITTTLWHQPLVLNHCTILDTHVRGWIQASWSAFEMVFNPEGFITSVRLAYISAVSASGKIRRENGLGNRAETSVQTECNY